MIYCNLCTRTIKLPVISRLATTEVNKWEDASGGVRDTSDGPRNTPTLISRVLEKIEAGKHASES